MVSVNELCCVASIPRALLSFSDIAFLGEAMPKFYIFIQFHTILNICSSMSGWPFN